MEKEATATRAQFPASPGTTAWSGRPHIANRVPLRSPRPAPFFSSFFSIFLDALKIRWTVSQEKVGPWIGRDCWWFVPPYVRVRRTEHGLFSLSLSISVNAGGYEERSEGCFLISLRRWS